MFDILNLQENFNNLLVWSDALVNHTLPLIHIAWGILIVCLAVAAWKTRSLQFTLWLVFTLVAAFIHFLVLYPDLWNNAFERTNHDILTWVTLLGIPFLVFYPLLALYYGIEQSSMNIMTLEINGLATFGLAIYFVCNLPPDILHCNDLPTPPAYAHLITVVIAILLLATTLVRLVKGIIRKNHADINLAIVLLIGNLYAIAIWAAHLHEWAIYTKFYMSC